MRVLGLLAAGAVGCSSGEASPPPAPPPPAWTADTQTAADGVNRFTFDLYARAKSAPGSLFLSPFSVATAFGMLTEGANGSTRDELTKVLHLPPTLAAVGDLGRTYTAAGKPYELSVANALWGQTGYPWAPAVQTRLKERYGAGLTDVDFKADPSGERGRGMVNRWVEERTRNRIKDLLPPKAVDKHTRLILANAVYFKGHWADAFKPAATSDQPFTRADGSKAPVPLMHRVGRYRYAQLDGFQVLELPYKGDELAMTVVLPKVAGGLPAVEEKLSAAALAGWVGKLESTPDVQLYLPKFKVEAELPLPKLLKEMGVALAFDPDRADHKGLVTHLPSGDDNLYVSAAFHKAFVEVAEQGTEAAAATAVVVARPTSAAVNPKPPVVFRADRPFLFCIRDVKHGTVLFVGRYAGPG